MSSFGATDEIMDLFLYPHQSRKTLLTSTVLVSTILGNEISFDAVSVISVGKRRLISHKMSSRLHHNRRIFRTFFFSPREDNEGKCEGTLVKE